MQIESGYGNHGFPYENDNGYTTYHFEVTAYLIDDKMLEFWLIVKKVFSI